MQPTLAPNWWNRRFGESPRVWVAGVHVGYMPALLEDIRAISEHAEVAGSVLLHQYQTLSQKVLTFPEHASEQAQTNAVTEIMMLGVKLYEGIQKACAAITEDQTDDFVKRQARYQAEALF